MRLIDAGHFGEKLLEQFGDSLGVTMVRGMLSEEPVINPLQEVLDEMKKLFVDEQGRCLLEHAEAMMIVKKVMKKYE